MSTAYDLKRTTITKATFTTAAFDSLKAGNTQYAEMVISPINDYPVIITNADIMAGTFSIERDSISGDVLEFGSAISSELTFVLNNDSGQFDTFQFEGGRIDATCLFARTNWPQITAFADRGSGTVTVTCASHGLMTSGTAVIEIRGSIDYDGIYTATYINANSFYITHGFTQTRTGNIVTMYEFVLGQFFIDKNPRRLSKISISALDAMIALDKPAYPIITEFSEYVYDSDYTVATCAEPLVYDLFFPEGYAHLNILGSVNYNGFYYNGYYVDSTHFRFYHAFLGTEAANYSMVRCESGYPATLAALLDDALTRCDVTRIVPTFPTITAFTNAGMGIVNVTCANHGLMTSGHTAEIRIYDSTNYDGFYTATYVDVNTFSIVHAPATTSTAHFRTRIEDLLNRLTITDYPAKIDFSARRMVQMIAELTLSCAIIDTDGNLKLTWYNIEDDSQFNNDVFRYFGEVLPNQIFQSDILENEITLSGLDMFYQYNGEDVTLRAANREYLITIKDNAFLNVSDVDAPSLIIDYFMIYILNGVGSPIVYTPVHYRPLSMETISFPHIMPFDKLIYSGVYDNINSYCTNITYRLNQNSNIEAKGQTAKQRSLTSYNA